MDDPMTLKQFDTMVAELKHPNTVYLSEQDFRKMYEMVAPCIRKNDEAGIYIIWITTKVRPKIRIVDLSESHLFVKD